MKVCAPQQYHSLELFGIETRVYMRRSFFFVLGEKLTPLSYVQVTLQDGPNT